MHKNAQEYITKTNKNFLLFQQIFPNIVQIFFIITQKPITPGLLKTYTYSNSNQIRKSLKLDSLLCTNTLHSHP